MILIYRVNNFYFKSRLFVILDKLGFKQVTFRKNRYFEKNCNTLVIFLKERIYYWSFYDFYTENKIDSESTLKSELKNKWRKL